MKTKILFLVSVLLVFTGLMAENTGCGFGTVLWSGQKGKVAEISAVTTNGTSYSNFFAITSGTSGYKENTVIGYNDVELFVDENMDMLATDMSKGRGEHLETLAELLEVQDKAAFKMKMQNNFSRIYSHDNISSREVTLNIISVLNS